MKKTTFILLSIISAFTLFSVRKRKRKKECDEDNTCDTCYGVGYVWIGGRFGSIPRDCPDCALDLEKINKKRD
jgi:hypothetical protein